MSKMCLEFVLQALVIVSVVLLGDCKVQMFDCMGNEASASCSAASRQTDNLLIQLDRAKINLTSSTSAAPAMFAEDFEDMNEGDSWCWYSKSWCKYLNIVGSGAGASERSLRVAYYPTSRGSDRLQQKKSLPEGIKLATLSYNVFFEEDFEWVRGGKLGFGLFGGQGTTGCKPIVADGWSVRLMWRPDGELALYLYHQNRAGRCGDYTFAKVGGEKFKFDLGKWYSLAIVVNLNDPPTEANGYVSLNVDGGQVAHVPNLQLRAADGAFIDNVGLSTFYGGSDPSWAPSVTTHVRYDDILVTASSRKGESVPAPSRGTASDPQPTPGPTSAPMQMTSKDVPCSKKWRQCGGLKWAGPKCCADGLTCFKKNDYYSQCK